MEPGTPPNKTRSYGEASRGARKSQNAPGAGTGSRPSYKERVKSAPLAIPQSEEPQPRRSQRSLTGRNSRESETSDTNSKSLSSSPSPIKQHVLPIQRHSWISQVGCSGEVQDVALAVLGRPAVGKSTFVHCALDLKRASESAVSSKKVSLEGRISIVRLIEMEMEDVKVTAEQKVLWPKKTGDENVPDIDGVLALYDVMDQSSLASMPSLLKALSKATVPTVLVSAKCDNPFNTWEVDQDTVENFCSSLQGVETFQTSASAPESHKRCISVILRNIMLQQRGTEGVEIEQPCKPERPARPRASTNTQPYAALHSSCPIQVKNRHGRAASEIPNSISRDRGQTTPMPPSPGWSDTGMCGFDHLGDSRSSRMISSGLSGGLRSSGSRLCQDASDDGSVLTSHCQREQGGAKSRNEFAVSSNLDYPSLSNTVEKIAQPLRVASGEVEEAAADSDSLDPTELEAQDSEDEIVKEPGVHFECLVDRLLSQPQSKSEAKFAIVFLCLYRKFAAPSTLILAVIRRFEELNAKDLPYLTRMESQLRYLNILRDWVSHYPGDFAHPLSRRIMTGFMQSLTTSREYATASKEITPHLDVVSEDDDTEWAFSDKFRSRANTTESFLTMSSVQSAASTFNADSPTLTADSSTEDVVEHGSTDKGPTSQPNRNSATPSTSSSSRSDSQSTGSLQTLLNRVENAQRQAQLLTPISRNMLTKIQWHQLMEVSEEQIARELTRIDWIMYSSIKPRDLIRHVSLQADQKDKCKSLEHVNRMIHQFNHVAFWVTNMILLRDKPKHRAKTLEKFMGVAWKLRYLNNYNSLGAVIAGINGTAVHRLLQTRELIPAEAQKQFMRLEILMGTHKSHFAYRLAFGNTSSSRIPFLPLHRRDLVLAEQGNRTYVDGGEGERINWKKFEIMGEVIISIQKSQEVGYPTIARNEEVQRLVLDGRFCKDDDILYERSLQIEGPSVGENTKKRFNWFQR